jgi:hypothetical protein
MFLSTHPALLSVCLSVSGLKWQATHAPAGCVYRLYSGRGKHLNTRIIITFNCWPSCGGKKVNVSVRKKGQELYLTCWGLCLNLAAVGSVVTPKFYL